MIARMTAEGVITLEPQNGAEVVALKHWEETNRVKTPATAESYDVIRGNAIEIIKKAA